MGISTVGDYRIDPHTSDSERQAIQLMLDAGADPQVVDGTGPGGVKDQVITVVEAVRFMYASNDFEKYLPALDGLGLKHPLDVRTVASKILPRVQALRSQVDVQIGLTPHDAGYCDAFVPAFFQAGLPQFADGGLGFGYPHSRAFLKTILDFISYMNDLGAYEPELTAGEAFAAVLDPHSTLPYGSCTEATYKILAAFRMAGVPCQPYAVHTQNHLFARYGRIDLDPSGFGKIGWWSALSADELGSMFATGPRQSEADMRRFWPDSSAVRFRVALDAAQAGSFPSALDEVERLIEQNPANIHSFRTFTAIAAQWMQQSGERDEAMRRAHDLFSRFSDNPYALHLLAGLCRTQAEFLAEAEWLMNTFPGCGHGEVFMAMANSAFPATMGEWINKALELAPEHPMALVQHAQILFGQGRFAEAEVDLVAAAVVAPNFPAIHLLRSAISGLRGNLDESYQHALKENVVFVGNPSGLLALANVSLQFGQLSAAKKIGEFYQRMTGDKYHSLGIMLQAGLQAGAFEHVITLASQLQNDRNPTAFGMRPFVYLVLATAYLAKGHLDIAGLYISEHKRLSEAVEAYDVEMLEVHIRLLRQEYAVALEMVRDHVQRFPQLSSPLSQQANVKYTLGFSPTEVRSDTQAALKLNSHDSFAHVTEFMLELEEHRYADAQARLLNIKSWMGESHTYHSLEALLALERGDLRHAKLWAQRALRMSDDYDALSLFVMGQVLVHEGDVEGARAIAERARVRYPFHPSGHMLLAQVAQRRGYHKAALEHARQAVLLSPFDRGGLRHSPYMLLIALLQQNNETKELGEVRAALEHNREHPGPEVNSYIESLRSQMRKSK